MEIHNHQRVDNYYWMRDDQRIDEEVLAHLNDENSYAEAMLAEQKPLQELLFEELKARIVKDDNTVPEKDGKYWYHSEINGEQEYSNYYRSKTLIMPARKSVSRHIKNLKRTLQHIVKRDALIAQLNPKIIGWANYYRTVVSSRIFNYLNHKLLFIVLGRLKQIHKTRSIRWITKRYFRKINRYKWTFYHDLGHGKRPMTLARYATIKITPCQSQGKCVNL